MHKQGTKSLTINDTIYLDLECLLPEYELCSNTSNKSYAENVDNNQASGNSTTIVRNHSNEKITTYYRGKDTLFKLCKKLNEKALSLINTEKKSLTPLTNEEQKKHDESTKCHICKKSFLINKSHKFYNKLIEVIDHGHYTGEYRGAAHSICNLTYETQRDIPAAIYNGSNYDFHLLIDELAKEFRSDKKCIHEDKEK